MPAIALFEPEIAGNVGTIIRTAACFNAPLHIIEPCGFPFDMQRIKKSALDYLEYAQIARHSSFEDFYLSTIVDKNARLILATTKGSQDYSRFKILENDINIFGKESAGVPDYIATKADAKILIPMQNQMRSLNLAVSCGIILARAVSTVTDS